MQPNKKARTGEGARFETELGRLVLGLRLGRGEGVLESDQVFTGLELIEELLLFLQLLGAVVGGLDGQTDAAIGAVNLDDAGGDVVADLEDVLDLVDPVFADLGDVNQTIDVVGQTNECTEAGQLGDLAGDQIAHLEEGLDLLPRIHAQLLHAEADALVGLVDFEHNRLDFVALLEDFARVVDLAGPAHVRYVHHTVQAFLKLEERAVAGEVADRSLDLGSRRILGVSQIPRVGLELTD